MCPFLLGCLLCAFFLCGLCAFLCCVCVNLHRTPYQPTSCLPPFFSLTNAWCCCSPLFCSALFCSVPSGVLCVFARPDLFLFYGFRCRYVASSRFGTPTSSNSTVSCTWTSSRTTARIAWPWSLNSVRGAISVHGWSPVATHWPKRFEECSKLPLAWPTSIANARLCIGTSSRPMCS